MSFILIKIVDKKISQTENSSQIKVISQHKFTVVVVSNFSLIFYNSVNT